MSVAAEAAVIGVAVEVPPPFGPSLRAARQSFGDTSADGIPTHVTLLPPTTVDATLLPEIEVHLAAVAAAGRPFRVRLHGTATFRPVSPVVFVVVAQGIGGCEQLERQVRTGVLSRPVHFPYHPHVTVAHDVPDDALDRALAELADFEAEFSVDRFSLYEHRADGWHRRRDFALASPS
jgi:2'-5' RNA ligase